MSVFIARIQKKNSAVDAGFEQERLQRYLPFAPSDVSRFHDGAVDGFFFNFGSALDSRLTKGRNCTILKQGYFQSGADERLENVLFRDGSVSTQYFPESFCALLFQSDRVVAYSSATGVDQLFFYSSENATYITNRHNLLGALNKNLTFKKSSFAWMLGRTHIGDMSTYWNEITRSKPGEKYIVTQEDFTSFEPDNRNLFDPIPTGDIRSEIADISSYFRDILTGVSGEKRLWLSGGKDSRAIFGLIDCASVRSDLKLTTGGEYYAPDVMAAQALSSLVGMADKHSISRPAITASKIVVAEKIANDLTVDFTGGSLADLRPISRTSVCIIGGHENGFKTKKNTKSLEDYVADRVHWVDNSNILTQDVRAGLFAVHRDALIEKLANVPLARYGQVDVVNNRNPNFLSSTITNSHVSSSEIHPFLDGRMYRLLCGVSDEALDSQFIHYAMMYNSDYALESLPFAADNWPESLYEIAKRHNMPLRKGRSKPFMFNSNFPTLKSFGLYDWRLNLVDGSQKFVREYINDNSGFFDFINRSVFNDLVSKDSKDFAFKEIYTFLSILKAAFVHYFNERIFEFSSRPEIAAEVNYLLDFAKLTGKPESSKENAAAEENAFLKRKLEDYEKSIAAIVRQHRDDENQGEGSSSISVDAILESMKIHAFDGPEGNPIVEGLLFSLGYKRLPESGIVVFDETANQVRGFTLSVDLFMDPADTNKLLVSFSSDGDAYPEGFNRSDAGFYFKYLSLPKGHGNSITNFAIKGLGDEVKMELKVMPWYSEKPIYYKDVSCKKL